MNYQQDPNRLTSAVIGAAIDVHREIGPGLLESAYGTCLAYELRKRGICFEREKPVPVIYGDVKLDCGYRTDFLIGGQVVIELKAKDAIHPIDVAQVLSYLRLLKKQVALLINFHEPKLIDGIQRVVNNYKPSTFV